MVFGPCWRRVGTGCDPTTHGNHILWTSTSRLACGTQIWDNLMPSWANLGPTWSNLVLFFNGFLTPSWHPKSIKKSLFNLTTHKTLKFLWRHHGSTFFKIPSLRKSLKTHKKSTEWSRRCRSLCRWATQSVRHLILGPSGPNLEPTCRNLGPCWIPRSRQVDISWPQLGPRWRHVAPGNFFKWALKKSTSKEGPEQPRQTLADSAKYGGVARTHWPDETEGQLMTKAPHCAWGAWSIYTHRLLMNACLRSMLMGWREPSFANACLRLMLKGEGLDSSSYEFKEQQVCFFWCKCNVLGSPS